MKPRKTRKYSKKSETAHIIEDRDESRGERKSKQYLIETITPMEHSYAAKVKGDQPDDVENMVTVSYMSGNPSVQANVNFFSTSMILKTGGHFLLDCKWYFTFIPY